MNREQMIAWLTLEGWEPCIYDDEENGHINYAIRHTDKRMGAFCTYVDDPVYKLSKEVLSKCRMIWSSGSWHQDRDKPGTWQVFTDDQLGSVIEKMEAK